MVLPVSTEIIRNVLGYLQVDISAVFNHLNTLDNTSSSESDNDFAETQVIAFGKNICKMARTLEERVNMTIPPTGYTNQQLRSRGIIP